MIRIGLVDFDTSHVVEFTRRLNHIDIDEDQWVEGARVVAGVPGTSKLSPERVPEYTAQMKRYEVSLFDRPEDLLGKIDAVMVESVDGSVHLDRARPFLERGMPTYVDKPFACTLEDARAMIDLAARTHAPIFSSSSLRYAPEVVAARGGQSEAGAILGAATFGPAPLDVTGRNPGLFHYGIHPVEMLYTLMGPGCERVVALSTEGADVVSGTWRDGRIGTVRGLRAGRQDYGFTVFGEKGVVSQGVGTRYIYRELLKEVVRMFETGRPPIEPVVTLELVEFIDAAARSARDNGAPALIS
jgi:virulence factor